MYGHQGLHHSPPAQAPGWLEGARWEPKAQDEQSPRPQEFMLFLPVHNSFPLQILQTTAQLGGIENSSLLLKARLAQVVDVKLQVPSIHNG